MKKTLGRKIIAQNRRARYDYEIEETFEAGLVLSGSEVKSLREGRSNINDAYAGEIDGEMYLLNAYIPEYLKANRFNHETKKPRKLLLHRKQINKLIGKVKIKSYSIVAISLYFNEKKKAKLEIGLGKGKKNHDRRQTEKDRDWDREKARIMNNE